LGGGCLLVHPELMDVQPRDLEILDLEAADHRASDRQPADRQGAGGPRATPDTNVHRTVRASSAVHAIVLQWSKVGVGFLALPSARPHFGAVTLMTYTV